MRAGLAVFGLGLGLLLLALAQMPGARAGELLSNADFETWSSGSPVGWTASGAAVLSEAPGASGSGARLDATSSASLRQSVAVAPGAKYHARAVAGAASGQVDASVSVQFLDDGLAPLVKFDSAPVQAGQGFAAVEVEAVAPSGAAYARVVLEVSLPNGPGGLVFDDASLQEVAAAPSPTPTEVPATPSPTPTATASPTVALPTPTVTPTATPTKTRTPGGGTAPPSKTPATPLPGPGTDDDGALLNGGFELLAGDLPAFWSKQGGEMRSEPEAFEGQRAVALDSTTSATKWLWQAVAIDEHSRYRLSGQARIGSGQGEAWLRVSWYLSGDGSGTAVRQDDSAITSSSRWTALTTGVLKPPQAARSARVRLMLRPQGAASASFDALVFEVVDDEAAAANGLVVPMLASDEIGARALRFSMRHSGGEPSAATSQQETGGLRISEVVSDPEAEGRDTAHEWVELENTGAAPVDLAGWQVGESKELDTLPSLEVPAGGFVVVAAESAVVAEGVLVVRPQDGDIGSGLNNAGDVVRLVAPDGNVVDSVAYGDAGGASAPGPGKSLARTVDGGWAIAARTTPGEANQFAAAPRGDGTPRGSSNADAVDDGEAAGRGLEAERLAKTDPRVVEVERESPVPWMLAGAGGALGGAFAYLAGRRVLSAARRRDGQGSGRGP
ncbi:MAG: lamin tail domain-containing protein [Hyphomicrobiales bacterium]